MKPETIKNLLDEGMSSDNLVEVLKQDSGLRQRLTSFQLQLESLEKVYKEKAASVKEKIQYLQHQCPHYETTYHPDPSGNNDSYYSCDLCGDEAKRREGLKKWE